MTEVTQIQIGNAIIGFLKNVASLLGALAVIGGAVWFVFGKAVDDYLTGRERPVNERLERIEISVQNIQRTLTTNGLPYIEFRGSGIVSSEQPVSPGQIVRVIYNLRRNLPCRTTVQVRFIDAISASINSAFTYEIPSTQASVTQGFQTFPIDVRLPENLPAGRWSYAPLLIPENCNGAKYVTPPISEFFDVERFGDGVR